MDPISISSFGFEGSSAVMAHWTLTIYLSLVSQKSSASKSFVIVKQTEYLSIIDILAYSNRGSRQADYSDRSSGITIKSLCSCLVGRWRRGQVFYFDISDFGRSHHVMNVRARSCCFGLHELFGITDRGRQKALTSNERSVALTPFKSASP